MHLINRGTFVHKSLMRRAMWHLSTWLGESQLWRMCWPWVRVTWRFQLSTGLMRNHMWHLSTACLMRFENVKMWLRYEIGEGWRGICPQVLIWLKKDWLDICSCLLVVLASGVGISHAWVMHIYLLCLWINLVAFVHGVFLQFSLWINLVAFVHGVFDVIGERENVVCPQCVMRS